MKLTSILLLCLLSTAAFAQNARQINRAPNLIGAVPSKTVAGLPTCNAAANNMIYLVTDALTPAVAATVVGGGAVQTLVHCNGSAWIVG